jgi:cytochrome b
MTRYVLIWDWPLRLFHWLLVLAVSGAYLSGVVAGDWTQWHEFFGLSTLWLLVFRLVWGLLGSRYARFRQFWPNSQQIRRYLQNDWQQPGHNPLGAIAVLALLGLLLCIVGSGLFANDDIGFEGPLYPAVDKALSDKLSGWHDGLITPLLLLLALHIAAIAAYRFIKGVNLLRPMISGRVQLAAVDDVEVALPALLAAVVSASLFTWWAVVAYR